jgi:phage gp29-like protein
VIAVGKDDKVEALGIGAGTAHFEAFERAVTARVQKLILGQTLTTDAGGSTGKSGSYALGKIHNQVREDRRNADLRLITKTIQRQVDALWVLNGFKRQAAHVQVRGRHRAAAGARQRDNQLLSSGKVSFSEEYYLRAYDFEEGEVVVTPDGTATGTGQPGGERDPGGAKASLRAASRRSARFTREQQAVEELVASAADNLPSPIDPEAIRNAIRAAKDPDDLIDRLGVLFADADKFTFARIIERALFASHVMGFAHATPQGRA